MAFLALVLCGALSQSPPLQAEALKVAKETGARSIDAALPAIPLERWLQQQLGSEVKIAWEVNDCGEATGSSADVGRDLPFCVEARARLRDGRDVTLAFIVGTQNQGLVSGPLALYHGTIRFRGESTSLHALPDLPKLLRAK